MRIPVPDRTGVIAEITVLVTELGHQHRRPRDRPLGATGTGGVLVVVVDQLSAPTLLATLAGRGYRATSTPVGPSR